MLSRLKSITKNSRLYQGIVILLLLSFVFIGTGHMFNGVRSPDSLVSVNGVDIHQYQLDALVSGHEAQAPEQALLAQLILMELQYQMAVGIGMQVTTDMIVSQLQALKVDPEKMQLDSVRGKRFVEQLSKQYLVERLMGVIQSTHTHTLSLPPREQLKSWHQSQTIDQYRLDASHIAAAQPNEAELQQYFNEHTADFITADQSAKIYYLNVPAEQAQKTEEQIYLNPQNIHDLVSDLALTDSLKEDKVTLDAQQDLSGAKDLLTLPELSQAIKDHLEAGYTAVFTAPGEDGALWLLQLDPESQVPDFSSHTSEVEKAYKQDYQQKALALLIDRIRAAHDADSFNDIMQQYHLTPTQIESEDQPGLLAPGDITVDADQQSGSWTISRLVSITDQQPPSEKDYKASQQALNSELQFMSQQAFIQALFERATIKQFRGVS